MACALHLKACTGWLWQTPFITVCLQRIALNTFYYGSCLTAYAFYYGSRLSILIMSYVVYYIMTYVFNFLFITAYAFNFLIICLLCPNCIFNFCITQFMLLSLFVLIWHVPFIFFYLYGY